MGLARVRFWGMRVGCDELLRRVRFVNQECGISAAFHGVCINKMGFEGE